MPDNYLEKGEERVGVLWEFQRGMKRQELTFVVKAPNLYRLVEAWGKLKPKLRSVIAALVDASLED